jgi:sugar lactone lactonase YvrE
MSQSDKIYILAEGLNFPEGPAWSERDQRLFFVEWRGNRVLSWDGRSINHVFSPEPGGGPSGLGISPEGNFWICLYDARKLALYSPRGKKLIELTNYQGQPFRGVCDLAVDSRGGVYFTDSGDFEDDWRKGWPAGSVYYLPPSGELLRVDTGLCFPNGIAVSPDESLLYVNEHRKNRTLVFDLLAEGRFGPRRVFFTHDNQSLLEQQSAYELGPDGSCLDWDGCIWAAHFGGGKLVQMSPDGCLRCLLHLPRGRMPTNLTCCPPKRLLYATEAEYGLLYQIADIGTIDGDSS